MTYRDLCWQVFHDKTGGIVHFGYGCPTFVSGRNADLVHGFMTVLIETYFVVNFELHHMGIVLH